MDWRDTDNGEGGDPFAGDRHTGARPAKKRRGCKKYIHTHNEMSLLFEDLCLKEQWLEYSLLERSKCFFSQKWLTLRLLVAMNKDKTHWPEFRQ